MRQFGNRIYFGDPTNLELLRSAHIEHARVLIIAVDNADDALQIAREVADGIEDPSAVLGTYLDGQPEIFLAEDVIDASTYDTFRETALLASWDGGQLSVGDYLAWAAAQPASWNRGGFGSDKDAFRLSIAELSRRRQGLDEVTRRGLRLSEEEIGEIRRDWDDEVYQWSIALGFVYGAAPRQVGEAALEALARTGQGANIARDELAGRAPLMRARYDVSVSPAGG